MRGSSALSVCPFEKCLKSINGGGTNSLLTAVLRSCELRAAVCAPEAPDSGSRARQAPIPRISLPPRRFLAQTGAGPSVVASSKSESDLFFCFLEKNKNKSLKMAKFDAFMRPGNPVSWHLLWHRYFLPFSLLRSSLRSPPTPACVLLCASGRCVCSMCASDRALQPLRYRVTVTSPPLRPPPVVH